MTSSAPAVANEPSTSDCSVCLLPPLEVAYILGIILMTVRDGRTV